MNEESFQKLVDLNRQFYERFASSFAETRLKPQPGFERLLELFSKDQNNLVLDVGCGNGRFGRYLAAHDIPIDYWGVDFSPALLALADDTPGRLISRDLSRENCLDGLGLFDVIVCLSTLQHIPGQSNRYRLLSEMKQHLRGGGRMVIANWQFVDSPRQRKKVREWPEVGLTSADVEPTDYLLSWQRGGFGLRYVAYLNETSIEKLANQAGLRILDQYRDDGREGDLNLYTILAG